MVPANAAQLEIEHVHEDACARRLAIAATLRLGLEFVRLLVE
jgi:hypothetical protein